MDKHLDTLLIRKKECEDLNKDISNNLAERYIRSFTAGRRNRLFNESSRGAKASPIIHSMIKIAKANNLDSQKY